MFLLVNKPKRITSHDVIDELRKITGIKKIGHAGTLDPNATGLLIVGIGKESTKKLGGISKNTQKTYIAEIVLGEERDTDDAEGKVRKQILRQTQDDKPGINSLPDLSNVNKIINSFIGEQEQIPPQYSAIKIKGKKAYEIARKGKQIELKPRKVIIHSIKLLDYKYPILNIECEVSSGTYIRSLARDIGKKLGIGAYLNNLRRTKIDKYSVKNAVDLGDINSENWEDHAI